MAKKTKIEELPEKQAEEENPEKPKKESKPIKLPVIIGIIAGALIIFAVLIKILILPFIVDSMSSGNHDNDKNRKESLKKKSELDGLDEKLAQFFETGRITTNPKASSQFVVVNLGITFLPKDEDALKELHGGKAGGEGGLPPKMLAGTKGVVNSVLGSYSVDELHILRDSLPSVFKNNLKRIFREKELFIKEVVLQEFIIQ